ILVPAASKAKNFRNPLEMIFGTNPQQEEEEEDPSLNQSIWEQRKRVSEQLRKGELEDHVIEIEVEDNTPSMLEMFSGQGNEQIGVNMQEMFGNLLPKKTKKRRLPIKEARKVLLQEEANKLIDM